jgi:hypothetical protein
MPFDLLCEKTQAVSPQNIVLRMLHMESCELLVGGGITLPSEVFD